MNACQSLEACSSFQAGSFGSFRKAAVIAPKASSGPAGFGAVAIVEAIWFNMNTGCQLRSAAIRTTFAAFAGTPANTTTSAPDRFKTRSEERRVGKECLCRWQTE